MRAFSRNGCAPSFGITARNRPEPAPTVRDLDRRLRHCASRPHLLIIDEVGYLSFDPRNADLLFQVVSRRYEKRSLAITTNLAFSEWPTIFPNASCSVALVDRLVHYADIIQIEGSSYRRRQAELPQSAPNPPPK